MGRIANSFIKDICYEKYYVIVFKFIDLTYIYCCPEHKHTFIPLEPLTSFKVSELNIMRYDTEENAKKARLNIPEFLMNDQIVFLDVIENTLIWELLT